MGNTTVGKDIQLTDLAQNYNSILFAYGSSQDRDLNIPGENLPGVFSARQFVGWYNGLPEHSGLNPPLESCETVSIIGNGNVALDVARVLLCNPDQRLKSTDITEEAYSVLKKSNVRHVRIVGRRGILQSAFTTKEIRELINEPGVAMTKIDERYIQPYRGFINLLDRSKKRMLQLIEKTSKAYDPLVVKEQNLKTFSLDYLLSPVTFYPGNTPSTLSATEFNINVLQQDEISAPAFAVTTNQTVRLENDLVFKSVGYKAVPIHGMEQLGILFDEKRGIVPNSLGRVLIHDSNGTIDIGKGLYVTGWVKTGPTGVIASTMREAFEVAESIIEDFYSNKLNIDLKPGFEGVKDKISKSTRIVNWEDWQKIDQAEINNGQLLGKSRNKFKTIEEMLNVLD